MWLRKCSSIDDINRRCSECGAVINWSPPLSLNMLKSRKRVDEERSLLNQIWQRKHRWIEHVLRHGSFIQGIFEGRMLGKRTRGRRRMQMLHDLTVNSDYVTLKQTAAERMMWRHSRGISRTCSTAEDCRETEERHTDGVYKRKLFFTFTELK